MTTAARVLCRLALFTGVLALAGCASMTPPRPWEKGELAQPSMRFDSDPNAQRYTEHVYDSKEKAGGGAGVGGGGCGCN